MAVSNLRQTFPIEVRSGEVKGAYRAGTAKRLWGPIKFPDEVDKRREVLRDVGGAGRAYILLALLHEGEGMIE